MKLTYKQIESLLNNQTVQNVLEKTTGVFGLNLYRVISKLQLEIEPFNKQLQKIIDEYAQKDENGIPVRDIVNNQQSIKIIVGKELEAANAVETLRSVEIDIDVDLIEFKVEENPTITTKELLSISPLLK